MASRDAIRTQYKYSLQDLGNLLEQITEGGNAASDTLAVPTNPANGKTVTIDAKVYTFKTILTTADGDVLIGATADDSVDNLIRAITLGIGAGTVYGENTLQHTTVTAEVGISADELIATSKAGGTAGNSIAVSTNVTGAAWDTPTLTGGSDLVDDVREKAITSAINEYSRRFFQIKTALYSLVSTGYYTLPADWKEGLSRIVSVEAPIDLSPPAYLAPKSWRLVRRETGRVLYVLGVPATAFRLTYTTSHDPDTPSTIPTEDEGALGRWAAKIAASEFMARYANSVQNNVDSANYRTKEEEWRHVYDTLSLQVDRELQAREADLQREAEPGTYFKGWDV